MTMETSKNFLRPLLNTLGTAAALVNVLLLTGIVLTTHYGIGPKYWEHFLNNGNTPQPTANNTNGIHAMPLPQVALEQGGLLPETVSQNISLTVPPGQSTEFRFSMSRDYEMDYHWHTDGKALHAELRGQKQGSKPDDYRVFGKIKESKGKGFFIAPFNGDYALQWQNKSNKPITIHLTAKGVFKVLG